MEILIGILGSGIGAGVMAIVLACLQRHWRKKDMQDTKNDTQDAKINALVVSHKLMMVDRVKHIAKHYINEGEISLDDKEHILEMYASYKSLGGNGHLDTIMNEINHLKVVGE